jgi:hypothetical protein
MRINHFGRFDAIFIIFMGFRCFIYSATIFLMNSEGFYAIKINIFL